MIDMKKEYEKYLAEVGEENDAYHGSLRRFESEMWRDLYEAEQEAMER